MITITTEGGNEIKLARVYGCVRCSKVIIDQLMGIFIIGEKQRDLIANEARKGNIIIEDIVCRCCSLK